MYLSPFDLTDLAADLPLDKEAVKRAKSKLLAHFELAGTVTIDFQGQSLDKQTTLSLLDQLTDPVQLENHRIIAQNPGLKRFIQTADFNALSGVANLNSFSRGFITWVSPWFARAFGICLESLLAKSRFWSVYDLMSHNRLVGPSEYAIAYQPFLLWLEHMKAQVVQNKYTQVGLSAIASQDIPQALALLPDVYRYHNDQWAELILLRVDQLLRINGNARAEEILIYADALRVTPAIKTMLNKQLAEIQKGNVKPKTGTRDLPEMDEPLQIHELPWGSIILLGIVIAAMVFVYRWLF